MRSFFVEQFAEQRLLFFFFLERLCSTKDNFCLACPQQYEGALTLESKLTYQCITFILLNKQTTSLVICQHMIHTATILLFHSYYNVYVFSN